MPANYKDSNFTLKECHRPPGWKCLCHTSANVSYVRKIFNFIYKACRLQNAGAGIKRAKTWQRWLANSEWVYTSHTTNRIPTQTRIPFCFTARVHDLSHARLSCISSTHDQEFKARTRKQNAQLLYQKLTVQNIMASHTHFVPTTGPKSAITDAKLTPNECMTWVNFLQHTIFGSRHWSKECWETGRWQVILLYFASITVSFRKHRSTDSFLLARVRYIRSMYPKQGSSKLQSQYIASSHKRHKKQGNSSGD